VFSSISSPPFLRLLHDYHVIIVYCDQAAPLFKRRGKQTTAFRPVGISIRAVMLAWSVVERAGYVLAHFSPSSNSILSNPAQMSFAKSTHPSTSMHIGRTSCPDTPSS